MASVMSIASRTVLTVIVFGPLGCGREATDVSVPTETLEDDTVQADADSGSDSVAHGITSTETQESSAEEGLVDSGLVGSMPTDDQSGAPVLGFDPEAISTACKIGGNDGEEALFEANALVPGGRFVSFGDGSVMIEGPADAEPRWHILRLSLDLISEYSLTPIVWPAAEGELQVRDVLGQFVLACDGAGCLVLELLSDGTLSALEGGRIAADVGGLEGTGVSTEAYSGSIICAFGDGLYCYKGGSLGATSPRIAGTLRTVIASGSGGRLRDVTMDGQRYAVSETGQLWTQSAIAEGRYETTEGWHQVDLETNGEPLIAVHTSSGYVSVLGEGGSWYLANEAEPTVFSKTTQSPPLVATGLITSFAGDHRWFTLDVEGNVIYPPAAGTEFEGCIAGPFDRALGIDDYRCGCISAVILVTETNVRKVSGYLGCCSD